MLSLDGDKTSTTSLFGGLELPANGGTIGVKLDPTKQTVTASAEKSGESSIDFVLNRIDETNDDEHTSEPIPLASGESLIVEYGKWQGGSSACRSGSTPTAAVRSLSGWCRRSPHQRRRRRPRAQTPQRLCLLGRIAGSAGESPQVTLQKP